MGSIPSRQACTVDSGTNLGTTEPNTRCKKSILSGRLGHNAEAKTAQNSCEYVILLIATQESWPSKFARTLAKGQLVSLEGTLKYREVNEDVEGVPFKHRVAEVHALSLKRRRRGPCPKPEAALEIETADEPADSADKE